MDFTEIGVRKGKRNQLSVRKKPVVELNPIDKTEKESPRVD
jgi:hypothetical protein